MTGATHAPGPRLEWIEPESLPPLADAEKLVLFGAGQGSSDLLALFAARGSAPAIVAIVDNDPSLHGKTLHGFPIMGPGALASLNFSRIVVTTVSGREAVAVQLDRLGYRQGADYVLIGRYPRAYAASLDTILALDARAGFLHPGARILHVGPGGFLGLECCLYALGYAPVSMDAYGFGVDYPDVTKRAGEYRAVWEFLSAHPAARDGGPTVRRRFESLFLRRDGRVLLDTAKLDYRFPHRLSAIPAPEGAFDVTISLAVLEHVHSPERSLAELHRVVKPGGYGVHRIITRDHRSFGEVAGYHPLSYCRYSQAEWAALNADKFYQNRLLPGDWQRLFTATGFDIVHAIEHGTYTLTDDEWREIHEAGHVRLCDRTQPVNCDFIVRRR